MVFDPTYPKVDSSSFHQADGTDFYVGAIEAVPSNAPEPRGIPVMLSCFVDATRTGNLVTHHSHIGIIIFCSQVPILWFLK